MTPHVIDENEWVIAVNKPAGLIVHSDGRTEEPNLADWILEKRPELSGIGEPWISPQGNVYPRPGIIHRLDRTTSGVILLAKTQSSFEFFKNEFRERRVEKEYIAIVHGHMNAEQGKIVAEIGRSRESPKHWFAEDCDEQNLRAAVTEWRVLKTGVETDSSAKYSTLLVAPRTGRTHQIRVHMAHIGHPLLADHLYGKGSPNVFGCTRPALHASRISVRMLRGERFIFEAPPPSDLPPLSFL